VQSLLVKSGFHLRVLARKPGPPLPQVTHFLGDLTDPSECRRAVNDISVIIHMAGEKLDSSRFWSVNVQGTKNLLDAAVCEGVERFVHVSSIGVIGADPFQAVVFDENAPCRPQDDYERTKWGAEKVLRQVGVEVPVVILRPVNVFGDRDPDQTLLALARTVRDGRFVFVGGRDSIINMVFVDDVAHAILGIAEHPSAVGRTYHLSDTCTLGEFVDTLADHLGVKRPTLEMPKPVARLVRVVLRGARKLRWLSNSAGFGRLVSLNNQASFASSRLADDLGFAFPVGWRHGVKLMVAWYRSQGIL